MSFKMRVYMSRAVIAAASVTLVVATGGCKTRGFHTATVASSDRGAAVRLARAAESLEPVIETIKQNAVRQDRQGFDADASAGPVLEFEKKPGIRELRPLVVAVSKKDEWRDLLETSIVAEQRRRSVLLQQRIFGNSREPIVYDTVIVGAGPHAAALAQRFTDLEPDRSVLVVESLSRPGGTFADVGPAFALNSTNRQDTGQQAIVGRGQGPSGTPGVGNLNAVEDLIGIPDFAGERWPVAGDLGYVTTVSLEYSSAQLLLNTRVTAIGKSSTPGAPVYVDLDTRLPGGTSSAGLGSTKRVEAQQIIVATGIGKATFFLESNQPSRQLRERLRNDYLSQVTSEKARGTRSQTEETKVPPVQSFGEFMSRINWDLRNGRNPMVPYAGKRILVVGSGDSGKVALEWLTRLGPGESYGGAQVGDPARVVWSGVDFLTCSEYIKQSRARYARLAQPLNSGVIGLAPVKITAISSPTFNTSQILASRIEAKESLKKRLDSMDAPVGLDSLSRSDKDRISGLLNRNKLFALRGVARDMGKTEDSGGSSDRSTRFVRDDGTLNLAVDEETKPFDILIDATGFRTELFGLLQAGFGDTVGPENFEFVKGKIKDLSPQFRDTERPFAAVLKDPAGSGPDAPAIPIFLAGPANEQVKPLVLPDETANVSANTVSLYANIERTKKLAEYSVENFRGKFQKAMDFSRAAAGQAAQLRFGGQELSTFSVRVSEAPDGYKIYAPRPQKVELEVALRKIFASSGAGFVGEPGSSPELWIFFNGRSSGGSAASLRERAVSFALKPGLADNQAQAALEAALSADVVFRDLLFRLYAPDPASVAPGLRRPTPTFRYARDQVYQVDRLGSGSLRLTERDADDLPPNISDQFNSDDSSGASEAPRYTSSVIERVLSQGAPGNCLVVRRDEQDGYDAVTYETANGTTARFGVYLTPSYNDAKRIVAVFGDFTVPSYAQTAQKQQSFPDEGQLVQWVLSRGIRIISDSRDINNRRRSLAVLVPRGDELADVGEDFFENKAGFRLARGETPLAEILLGLSSGVGTVVAGGASAQVRSEDQRVTISPTDRDAILRMELGGAEFLLGCANPVQ